MEIETAYLKPPIKWVGGKTQILDKLLKLFPSKINNYYEIFLGGGSVLLGLLTDIKNKKLTLSGNIYAYDKNSIIINMYKEIQNNPIRLYDETIKIVNEYNNIKEEKISTRDSTDINDAKKSKECYYYWLRKEFNDIKKDKSKIVKTVALFIFLNKTCFRGLYREGKNGYNVPYGFYKNPEIINREHILKISELIKDVKFEDKDYKESLRNEFKKDDFIYFDPPYYPENNKSFVSYNESGFDIDEHKNLFEIIQKLETNFMMSNSSVDFVKNVFNDEVYIIDEIEAKRSINSKKPNSKTKELIIKNYLIY